MDDFTCWDHADEETEDYLIVYRDTQRSKKVQRRQEITGAVFVAVLLAVWALAHFGGVK